MIEDDTKKQILEIRKEEAAIEQQIEDAPICAPITKLWRRCLAEARLAQIRQEEDEIDRQVADLYRAIQYRKGY